MLNNANLFRLVSEFIVLLLGGLLVLLAATGRAGLPARPAMLVGLGVIFLYWGARAWMRPEPKTTRLQRMIRAGSLALVGIVVASIPYLPVRDTDLLVGIAGGVLVLRGLIGGALSVSKA
jgi:hypothetical protein